MLSGENRCHSLRLAGPNPRLRRLKMYIYLGSLQQIERCPCGDLDGPPETFQLQPLVSPLCVRLEHGAWASAIKSSRDARLSVEAHVRVE